MLVIQYHLAKDVAQHYEIRIPDVQFSDFNTPRDILNRIFDHPKIQSIAYTRNTPVSFAFTRERKHYTGTIAQNKENTK